MISAGERVFIDTGAWVALAVAADPLHSRARAIWESIARAGARRVTSVPVVIETFTFLARRGSPALATTWRESLVMVPRLEIAGCAPDDLDAAWKWFDRRDLHKLSLVDATSFVLMQRRRIRVAFAFDADFLIAGFRQAG